MPDRDNPFDNVENYELPAFKSKKVEPKPVPTLEVKSNPSQSTEETRTTATRQKSQSIVAANAAKWGNPSAHRDHYLFAERGKTTFNGVSQAMLDDIDSLVSRLGMSKVESFVEAFRALGEKNDDDVIKAWPTFEETRLRINKKR